MKKIIIADTIQRELNRDNTLFGRKSIVVFPACSSEDMIELHRAHDADLIITEQDFPIMGGSLLCSRIRSDASLKAVSIILICPANEPALTECRNAQANAVIQMPVDRVELFTRVSELLVVSHRRDLRLVLRITLKGTAGSTAFEAVSHNISVSGILLESKQALDEGASLRCSFQLGSREVALECTVVRAARSAAGTWLCGVKFSNMSAATYILLEHFLKDPRKQKHAE